MEEERDEGEGEGGEGEGGEGERSLRIYVGGLGKSVTEDDLQRMFGGGGSVGGVDIIRTKARSFAYVDFRPSSDKSLAKLFTTYNGCVWKGGKLRLHKAKEHYLVRMRREWDEDAAAAAAQLPLPVDADDIDDIDDKPKSKLTQEQQNTKQLRIFFPTLRMVKSVPFSGTGKHKYSFQRVQVPSLPINFCDCEEHSVSVSSHPAAQQSNQLCHVINEHELNIMNKVMDKLFQKENVSVSVSDSDHTSTAPAPPPPNQQHHEEPLHFDDTAADDEDEEDNLIINVVTKNQDDKEKNSEFQELLSCGTKALKENVLKAQKNISGPPKKKRKSLLDDNNNQNEFAIHGDKKNLKTHSNVLGKLFGAQPDQPELSVQQSTAPVSWSQKSSWRQLVGHRGNSGFRVSHILTGTASSTDQVQPKSGGLEVPHSESNNQDLASNGNFKGHLCEMELVEGCVEPQPTKSFADSNKLGRGASNNDNEDLASNGNLEGHLCEMELVEGRVEPQPTKSIVDSNKSGRGASWRQKSSWTQLINENTATSFSITQILPGISFEQQVFQKPKVADVVSSIGKLKETVKQDNNKFTRGGSSSVGIGKGSNAVRSAPVENQQAVVRNDAACAPDLEKIFDLTPKQASAGTVEISETCSFMRSAASLKEWAKTKAALSGSMKKKNIEN